MNDPQEPARALQGNDSKTQSAPKSLRTLALDYSPSLLHPLLQRLGDSELGSRLALGVFWSMAGSMVARGLMLCATVLVARILGRSVYGELGMIQSSIGLFSILAGFGMGLTAAKHVAEYRQGDPERAGRIIGLSVLFALLTGGAMALGLFFFAPSLAKHTIDAPHLARPLRIGALMPFIDALSGAQIGALSGLEAFKAIACVNLLVGFVSCPVLIAGAYFGGLTGAVWALVINLCINCMLIHIALRRQAKGHCVPLTFVDCGREWPVLWRFTLPAFLSAVLVGPVNWVCNAMLVNQQDGYSEMGMFTAAFLFQNVLLATTGVLNAPLLAILSSSASVKNKELETANILSSWFLGLVPAIPLLCFPELAEIFFGGDYAGHTFRVTFVIVAFTASILVYRSGLLRAMQARGLLWWGLGNNLLWAAVLLPTAYCTAKYGASGLAAAYAIAYISTSVVFVPVYLKYASIPKALLLSKDAAAIWLVVVILATMTLFESSILCRSIALPLGLFVAGSRMRNIWVENSR